MAIPGVPLALVALSAEEGIVAKLAAFPAALIALFLAPLGIYVAGNAAGGRGDYWWTFLGTLLGAVTIIGAPFLMPTFGILAYELSFDPPAASTGAMRSGVVLPTLEMSGDRAILGVGGSF